MNPTRRQSCPNLVPYLAAGSNMPINPPMPSNSISNVPASNITVAVRIRPLNKKEIEAGTTACCEVVPDSKIVVIKKYADILNHLKSQMGSVHDYAFDHAFGANSTQKEIYENTTKPYLNNLLNGLNVTVFAYGATGAGKTHTMLGNSREDSSVKDQSNFDEAGIIPMAVVDLFSLLNMKQKREPNCRTEIIATYIEVYNEQVYDLLVESGSGKALNLREDTEKGIMQVSGVTEIQVQSASEVMDYLHHGNKNRKTETTMANQVSSRSHAVFQLLLRQKRVLECGRESIMESKLSLIDLAGSERASSTNNRGLRLQEGANINKSLLALANCINALAENSDKGDKSRKEMVKYRDSKLTHLLKSSLEGNCSLVMIANINPSNFTYEDSHNTLKYANRAKNIKVNPVAKEAAKDSNWLERETRLREENKRLREQVDTLASAVSILQNKLSYYENNGGSSQRDMADRCEGEEILQQESDDEDNVSWDNKEEDCEEDNEILMGYDDEHIFSSVDEYIQSQISNQMNPRNENNENKKPFSKNTHIERPRTAEAPTCNSGAIASQPSTTGQDNYHMVRPHTASVIPVSATNQLSHEQLVDEILENFDFDEDFDGDAADDEYLDESDDLSVHTIDSAIERIIPANGQSHNGSMIKHSRKNRNINRAHNGTHGIIFNDSNLNINDIYNQNINSNANDNQYVEPATEVLGAKARKKSMETINSMLKNLGLSKIGAFVKRQPDNSRSKENKASNLTSNISHNTNMTNVNAGIPKEKVAKKAIITGVQKIPSNNNSIVTKPDDSGASAKATFKPSKFLNNAPSSNSNNNTSIANQLPPPKAQLPAFRKKPPLVPSANVGQNGGIVPMAMDKAVVEKNTKDKILHHNAWTNF